MVVVRLRSSYEHKEMLHKLKKMAKFTKELVKCFEEKADEDDDDDEEDYRYDEDYDEERMHERRGGMAGRRYRRSM